MKHKMAWGQIKISLYLPEPLWRDVKHRAQTLGLPSSTLIRTWMVEKMNEEKKDKACE